MANAADRPRGIAKVPLPYLLPDGVITQISLKKWFNVLNTYYKQNNEYLLFYPGGEHEEWTAFAVDRTRGLAVHAVPAGEGVADADVVTAQQARDRTAHLRRDLDTLLSNYACYVPESYYAMVIEDATSIQWIYNKLAQSLNLESTKQYILNSHAIHYEPDDGDTPEKLYMRLRSHYQQAAPKAGTNFNNVILATDININPLVELMLVEKTLEKIDQRLPAHIVKTRGHLMEDGSQTLFCARRLLFNQVDTMLDELNRNGNDCLPDVSTNSDIPDKFCGYCFRARRPQSDHHIDNCPHMTPFDKKRLLKKAIKDIDSTEDNNGDCESNQ